METEKQKELFVATLIHDLKNPILAQINSLSLLLNGDFGKLNNTQQEIINLTLNSCKYVQQLICNALCVYKNDNGQIKLVKNYFNPIHLLKTCVNENKNSFLEKQLTVNVKNSICNILYADEKQIRRVIENIFNNQILYSLKNTQINIEIQQQNNTIIFIFENYSLPIDKKTQQEMFNKYKTQIKQNFSTGLGMYLSKQIVEAHNGKIYCICDKNINKFIFELPTNDKTLNCVQL